MESARAYRVGELIKEELSEAIRRELKDPRIGFVTITGVDVSADLRYANVYIGILGSKKQREDSLEALRNSSGYLRKLLARKIRIKYFPELKFFIDPSIEVAVRIEKLLRKVNKEQEKKEVEKENE